VQALLDKRQAEVKTVRCEHAGAGLLDRGSVRGEHLLDSEYEEVALTFDGADGVGGTDGCPTLTYGTYSRGTTMSNGSVSIIVPPLSLNLTTQYLSSAGRRTSTTRNAHDDHRSMYSEYPVLMAAAGSTRRSLVTVATASGRSFQARRRSSSGRT